VSHLFSPSTFIPAASASRGVTLNSLTPEEEAFQKAKQGLAKNPTEGQVETDVIVPFLKLVGYSNIQSKVTVETHAGRKVHTGTQADIVAYEQPTESLPTVIVDAKAPDVGISKTDLPQVQSYAISPSIKPRSKYVMLSNGYATQIYPIDSDDPVFTADLQTLFKEYRQAKEILTGRSPPTIKIRQIDIDNFFKKSHDLMYSQDSIKPTQALIVMTKLILIKMWEERGLSISSLSDVLKFKDAYFDKTKPIQEKQQIDENIRSYINNLLANITTDIIPLNERPIGTQISIPVLFEIVQGLSTHHIGSVKADVQGRAFEIYLGNTLQGRELGQYFTPRMIVDFMVDVINPTYSDLIVDPACGTGGFLRQAYLKIRDTLEDKKAVLEDYTEKKKFLREKQIYGIDRDPLAVQLCMSNMFMWGDSHSHIHRGDAIVDDLTQLGVEEGRFTDVLTNPPFGSAASVKMKAQKIPLDYELSYKWEFNEETDLYEKTGERQDQDAGIIFLERCVKLAAPAKGRIAIILPLGVFNNKTTEYVRQWIHQKTNVRLVVSLPLHTFKLAGANNFTAILFAQRKAKPNNTPAKYVVSIANHIGFDEKGNTSDKQNKPIPNDLQAIKEKFDAQVGWLKSSE